MMDDVERIAKGLTKAERKAFLKHNRTDTERWLDASVLGEHACELLYQRSLNMELLGKPPLWERRLTRHAIFGQSAAYRPSAVLGLAVRTYLQENPDNA